MLLLLLLFCCLKKNLSTPLHLAATYGFLEITKVLVLSGAQVDSRDLEQRTPMHMYWKYFFLEENYALLFYLSRHSVQSAS